MYAHLGKLIVAFVFVLHGAAPAVTHVIGNNSRIIHGQPATDVDTSYVVSILFNMSHICGGSIINERTVVSAAVCVYGAMPLALQVHIGSKTLSIAEGVQIAVATTHTHPKFDPYTLDYDISLLRLIVPLTFSSTIRPIRLADSGEKVFGGSMATALGWGQTETGSLSDELLYIIVPIVDQETCAQIAPYYVSDRMVCAGYSFGFYAIGCGDSGGPLVQNDKLIGIASWSELNNMSAFARVAALRSWVDKTLAKHYNEQL